MIKNDNTYYYILYNIYVHHYIMIMSLILAVVSGHWSLCGLLLLIITIIL